MPIAIHSLEMEAATGKEVNMMEPRKYRKDHPDSTKHPSQHTNDFSLENLEFDRGLLLMASSNSGFNISS